MIERYDSPEISDIWADHNKFKTYLDVELALIEALEGTRIPEGIAQTIKSKAVISPERIKEIEKITKHDVIAFCTSITENLPHEIRDRKAEKQFAFLLPDRGFKLDKLEQDLLQQALNKTLGNQSKAARMLGLTRDTFLYRLKKYSIA